jgi:hypothetical protein
VNESMEARVPILKEYRSELQIGVMRMTCWRRSDNFSVRRAVSVFDSLGRWPLHSA